MATVPFSNHTLLRTALRNVVSAVKEKPEVDTSGSSLGQLLAGLGRVLLGTMLLLVGAGMIFTFWLLPVGLPLALLGIALITTPHKTTGVLK